MKQLWHSRGTGWTWGDLGNPFAPDRFVGPITAASAGGNSVHVFGLGSSGNVLQMWFDGTWHATDLGNGFAGTRFEGPLSATSLFPGRLDVFGRDSADRLLQLWFDGTWHWSVLGIVLGQPGPSETRSIAATSQRGLAPTGDGRDSLRSPHPRGTRPRCRSCWHLPVPGIVASRDDSGK